MGFAFHSRTFLGLAMLILGFQLSCTAVNEESPERKRLRQQHVRLELTTNDVSYFGMPIAPPGRLMVIPPSKCDYPETCDGGWSDGDLRLALDDLRSLEELEHLMLRGTQLTDAAMSDIATLSQLRHLNMGSTKITDIGVAELRALSHLEGLYLEDAYYVHGKGLVELSKCPLKTLYFRGARINDSISELIPSLHHLEYIDLSHTTIRGRTLKALGSAPKLKGIWIYGVGVSDADIRELRPALQLESLVISGDNLSREAIHELCQLPQLRRLKISGCALTPESIADLRKEYPKIEILTP